MRQVPVDDLDDTPYSKWPDKAFREEFGQTKKEVAGVYREKLLQTLDERWLYPSEELMRQLCPVAQDLFQKSSGARDWEEMDMFHSHLDEIADAHGDHVYVEKELREQILNASYLQILDYLWLWDEWIAYDEHRGWPCVGNMMAMATGERYKTTG